MNIFCWKPSIQYWGSRFKRVFRGLQTVDSVKIISDILGRSKGFGFVEMPNDDEAQKRLMNWTDYCFKTTIVVNKSEPKPEGKKKFKITVVGGDSRGGYGGGNSRGGDNRGGGNRGGY
jgi:RNA recognition motif-containing protein